MQVARIAVTVILAMIGSFAVLTAQEPPEVLDEPSEDAPDYAVDLDEFDPPESPIFSASDMGDEWELIDTNDDGRYDYAVIVDRSNRLVRAAMDYSGDGSFDNFYYYDRGALTVHEIDTNGDRAIDLRIFLADGEYISRYEQDTNHDGTKDRVEEYGEE